VPLPPEFPAGSAIDQRLLEAVRRCCEGVEAYFVGGLVRDLLLARRTADHDLVVAAEPRPIARCLAAAVGAHCFPLDEERAIWRVVGDRFQLDLERLQGGGIEADLGRRDLTINALAVPLDLGRVIDPLGGLGDLAAGRLRAASREAFRSDPLRVVRLARFACELGFKPEEETVTLAAQAAPALAGVAAERILAELVRIVGGPNPPFGMGLLQRTGADRVVLPELVAERGVQQNPYHHLDVYDHTLECLAYAAALRDGLRGKNGGWELAGAGELEAFLSSIEGVREELAQRLSGPVGDGLDRFGGICFGALLHDIAKPPTKTVGSRGWAAFPGHDLLGARMAEQIVRRLHGSRRLREYLAGLVAHHLRLGFLLHERDPLAPRTRYAYLRACGPVGVDVTLLSVADRLATRGRNHEQAIAAHLNLAAQILPYALAFEREGLPALPLAGDELARAVGIEPGPLLGELLEELRVAAYAGEVKDRAGAVAVARALLASRKRGA
jgi:poly(A) polymerase